MGCLQNSGIVVSKRRNNNHTDCESLEIGPNLLTEHLRWPDVRNRFVCN